MSFAAYKEWAIPEGKVTQIADASGRVLWKAGDGTRRISFPQGTSYENTDCDINFENIYAIARGWDGEDAICSVGAIMEICAGSSYLGSYAAIYVNGVLVTSINGSGSGNGYRDIYYYYTVTKDATVTFKDSGYNLSCYITEE